MNTAFYFLPVLSALVGWLIHSIIAYYLIHRYLPARKKAIGTAIGTYAAAEFASFKGLEEKINDPANLEKIMPAIESHIDHFLNEKLKQEMPVISMFIGNKTTDKLKEVFMKEIQVLFPQVIGQFAGNLKDNLNLRQLIEEKINNISPTRFSSVISQQARTPIRYFRLAGALAGFIIGLIQLGFTIYLLTN